MEFGFWIKKGNKSYNTNIFLFVVVVVSNHSNNILALIAISLLAKGVVKWFNGSKGFGFIVPESGEGDVYVHISAVLDSGLRSLNEKDKVSFEIVKSKGRMVAVTISILD